ncbi:MAG: phosphocholine cytidylyltransferase family protein [Holosporales bacterium]|jgi:choline kinase|nr:phosphocholine cytidylyltransferase family protein [Holosporales bacterium]
MRGLILAAGRGSRMGSLTEEQPKSLVSVLGKPLIEHQLTALKEAGIRDICVVTGYQSQCLEPYGTCRIHNPRWAETNMVYSMLCAASWLKEDDCIVSYADIFYTTRLVRDLIESSTETLVLLAYDPNWLDLWRQRFADPLQDAETFRMSVEGRLLEIGQKPSSIEEIQGQYMGLLLFKKEFWRTLPAIENDTLFMTDFLRKISEATPIKCVPNPYPWGEIDQISDLHLYEKKCL